MIKHKIFIIIVIIFFLSCQKNSQKSILVMCGSANKPPMEEIAILYEKEKNVKVRLIFGGSGTLLSQIELTRKGDIYLPGSPDYIIKGEKKNLLIKNSDKIIAYLIPAIIVPKENPKKIENITDLTKPGVKIGIGNPESVCLGLYAIEYLEKNNLLETILNNVVTFGGSCSKTANLASMNQVDAIIGWKVFSHWNPYKMTYIPLPKNSIPRLSYIPVSIPVNTKNISLSKDFIEFLLSKTGKKIYKKYGYISSIKKAKKYAPLATIGGEYKLPKRYFMFIHNEE